MGIGKVLFIDTAHPVLQDRLEAQGFVCEAFEQKNPEFYQRIAHQYVGFVVRSKIPLDETILPLATQLKFIARVGAGMENIDVDLAEKLGIVCLNAPEGNRDAVGEHAIGMLLALFNKLAQVDQEVRQGIWRRAENRGTEIKGKTIGLIGYGNTGSVTARKLSGFEAEILAYDKYKSGFSNSFVKEAAMEEIFERADIVSLHIPLTPETDYLVNQTFLSHFKKPVVLINTSRGRNVNTADLIAALKSGKVTGACLDVLEFEKFSFEDLQADALPDAFRELLAMPRVLLSPHIAGWTNESHYKLSAVLADKIKDLNLI
ncbi:MAG: NAD(P)-dependent oxidoreductase [Bacteroidales bacterium]|jgi:D-3-phosphoglycerate dehydrogenase|nr:NAD(P)-dependent oxidoreductase [Bacteroidales bacterium]HOI31982.1 NAD(P)-dependent oxidoreductase [Bacteroidales bacterium]